jgi:hypothetical protein
VAEGQEGCCGPVVSWDQCRPRNEAAEEATERPSQEGAVATLVVKETLRAVCDTSKVCDTRELEVCQPGPHRAPNEARRELVFQEVSLRTHQYLWWCKPPGMPFIGNGHSDVQKEEAVPRQGR